MRYWATAIALAASSILWLEADADTPVTLNVKPVLCITDERNESCEISFAIAWESETAGSFCLHSDGSEEPIVCWQEAASGRTVQERVFAQGFTYWLTNGSDDRIAEVKVEVMTTADDRRRNRRRRHVWDIL